MRAEHDKQPLRLAAAATEPADRPRWLAALLLLSLGALIGIAYFNSPGTRDVQFWLTWMRSVHAHGILATYGAYHIDYPPLSVVIVGIAAHGAEMIGISDFAALKASLILFTLACAALMAVWDGGWQPTLAIATFLVLALDALCLVYLDVYFVFFVLLALLCLKQGRPAWGTALFMVSVLVKWQPILLAPLIFFYVVPRRPRLRDFAPFIPAVAILAFACLLWGAPMRIALFDGAPNDPVFSGNALNFNWLLSALMEYRGPGLDHGLVRLLFFDSRTPLLTQGINPLLSALSTTLRYVCYAAAVLYFYLSKRDFAALIRASIACFMAYFVFGHGVHENHACLPAVLAICWMAIDRARYLEAVLIGLIFNLNLVMFYGFNGHGRLDSRLVGIDVTLPLAAFGVVVFAVLWLPLARNVASRAVQSATAALGSAALRTRVWPGGASHPISETSGTSGALHR